MNNLILILSLTFLFFTTKVSSQIQSFEISTSLDIEGINYYDSKKLVQIFLNDLESSMNDYFEVHFVPDIYRDKINSTISNIKNNSIISVNFELNKEGVLGESYSMNDDSRITLRLNPNLWNQNSNYKKIYVLYHELGHDVLNFEHGEGGKMMFPISDNEYDWKGFDLDRRYMFESYFDKQLEKLEFRDLMINFVGSYLGNNQFWNGTYFSLDFDKMIYNKLMYKGSPFNGKTFSGKYVQNNLYDGTLDNYVNGKKEGKSITYSENGNIERESNYVNGRKEGKTIFYYENGNIKSESNYLNNELEGQSITYYENGSIKYESNYVNGKTEGKSITYYENGNIETEGNYENGRKEGKSIFYYENGLGSIVRLYHNDILLNQTWNIFSNSNDFYLQPNFRTEKWTVFLYDIQGKNKKKEIHYFNGKEEGKYIEYYENGNIKEERNYENGKEEGKYISYHENGNIWEVGNYENGMRVGDFISYFDDGVIKGKRYFLNDKLEGKVIDYWYNGNIYLESNYVNGILEGKYNRYYENGNVEFEGEYVNGEFKGEIKWYYENGRIKEEFDYLNGKNNGNYKSYYENGVLKEEGEFIDDNKVGKWIEYDEKGKKINTTKY